MRWRIDLEEYSYNMRDKATRADSEEETQLVLSLGELYCGEQFPNSPSIWDSKWYIYEEFFSKTR